MQPHRLSRTAIPPLGSRAPHRRQRILAGRYLRPLGLVRDESLTARERPPSAGELVADVMALIDAGLVEAVVSTKTVRYAPVNPDIVMNENVMDVVVDPFVGDTVIEIAAAIGGPV